MYDRLGNGFTLLRLGSKPPAAASLAAAARERGVPLDILDVPDAATREIYGSDLALIRPDQHVAWCSDASPADAGAVLARVTGA